MRPEMESMRSQQAIWNPRRVGFRRQEWAEASLTLYLGARQVLACGAPTKSPAHAKSSLCELHNQTMTVTSFAEV
jgi:hypothetical protein